MIRLRLSSFSTDVGDLEIPINVNGETAHSALLRITKDVPLDRPIHEVFSVLVSGEFVDEALWDVTDIFPDTDVLVVPNLLGGEANNLARVAVAIGAIVLTGGLASAGFLGLAAGGYGAYAAVAAINIAANLLAGALFPPPEVDTGLSDTGGSLARSQMYSISGQTNTIKKFDIVPRVYGRHRVYPNIVAVPYTELVTDSLGELVQDYYAIYDFGLGPIEISDIRIGDTPITSFGSFEYRLVDLHAPEVSTGNWDNREKAFALYKGDVSSEQISATLENSEQDIPQVGSQFWYLSRFTATNIELAKTEITVNMVCPQGLYGTGSNGDRGTVVMDIRVQFRRVGGNSVWRDFDNSTYVSSHSKIGAMVPQEKAIIPSSNSFVIADLLAKGLIRLASEVVTSTNGITRSVTRRYSTRGGLGAPIFAADGISNGSYVTLGGVTLGTVISKTPISVSFGSGSYSLFRYDIDSSTKSSVEIIEVKLKLSAFNNSVIAGSEVHTILTPKVYYSESSQGILRISGTISEPKYLQVRFTPIDPGQYEVSVTRVRTIVPAIFTFQVTDSLVVTEIRTSFDRVPIRTQNRHLFLELKIRATNQLNGNIQNLSATCTSVLDYYDPSTSSWKKAPTTNPAWVFADILTGTINKRAIDKSRLHTPSLLEWAAFCSAVPANVAPQGAYLLPRFESNFVMDYVTTVQALLEQVSSAAQASMNIVDGKYGVLLDKLKTIPVQVFTPRNSSDFSSSRGFSKQPNALNIKYISPDASWQVSELIVYDDGFNEVTAEEFQDATTFACTNAEQAYRFGRYLLAQNRLRREVIQLKVDFEHLVCTRGDYVLLVNDAMAVGGSPARVKSMSGNVVTIDDAIETLPLSYGYTFRAKTGQVYTSTLTVLTAETFQLAGATMPQAGDLIVIGEVTKITYDCLVKSITPDSEHGAIITLVEKADGVYSAENGGPLPLYKSGISNTVNAEFAPPGPVNNLVVVKNDWQCAANGYLYYVDIDWDVPVGSAYEKFEVLADYGKGYDIEGTTKATDFRYVVSQSKLGVLHSFKVVAVSATGKKLDLGEIPTVAAIPRTKTTPPGSVESLDIDITGEVLQMVWPQIADCDVFEYLIRYSPSLTGTWETSVPLLRVDRNTTLSTVQARTGTYLIKAVDFNRNESVDAALAITTIPNLFNLNLISTTTDFPALAGTMDQTTNSAGTLTLTESVSGGIGVQQYYPYGYYYYDSLLSLGDIYTVRLQSLIEAQGYSPSDVIANWITLDTIVSLYTPGTSDWDVEAQYRTTDRYTTVADWLTLSSVLFMNVGAEEVWTPWRKIAAITDATGSIFQFRLKLSTIKASVSPQIINGVIRADMPDRIVSYNNLTAPTSGYSVVYSPAFTGPTPSPSVQISVDDAATGDYWSFTSKSVNGFTIRFYDKLGNPVSRVFDAQIKGWGRKHPSVI